MYPVLVGAPIVAAMATCSVSTSGRHWLSLGISLLATTLAWLAFVNLQPMSTLGGGYLFFVMSVMTLIQMAVICDSQPQRPVSTTQPPLGVAVQLDSPSQRIGI